LAEACELLEGNHPIEWMFVMAFQHDERVLHRVQCGRKGIPKNDSGIVLDVIVLNIIDKSLDFIVWKRLGRAIRNSTLRHIYHRRSHGEVEDAIAMNGELFAAATRCINAFLSEVKHNKSIVVVNVSLIRLPMDDLSEFIQKNKALKELTLESEEPNLLD
jgi:hypothetical protein